MSTEVVKAEAFGIEESKANEMTSGLDTIKAEREILKEAYLDVIKLEVTEENLKTFKELRLKIRNNRTKGIEKWHTANKAFFLAGGRFVDAVKNKEIAINQDWESKLLAAEKHFENLELERIEALRVDRMSQMEQFDIVTNDANVELMSNDVWTNYLNGVKLNFEQVKAAELKAEKERIEQEKKEAEEREAQRLENIKLKEEAEAREKKIEAERVERERLAKVEADKQAAIQAKIKAEADAKLKKENEAREKAEAEAKKAKAKADQLIKENEAREEAARVETERLATEEKARLKAEQDAKKAAEQAPDKEKLKAAIELVRKSFEPVSIKNSDVKAVAKEIESKLIGWYNWANKEVNNLK